MATNPQQRQLTAQDELERRNRRSGLNHMSELAILMPWHPLPMYCYLQESDLANGSTFHTVTVKEIQRSGLDGAVLNPDAGLPEDILQRIHVTALPAFIDDRRAVSTRSGTPEPLPELHGGGNQSSWTPGRMAQAIKAATPQFDAAQQKLLLAVKGMQTYIQTQPTRQQLATKVLAEAKRIGLSPKLGTDNGQGSGPQEQQQWTDVVRRKRAKSQPPPLKP
eukprot:2416942-Amphidinium_carterae.1